MIELDSRNISYNFIFSGQHKNTIDDLMKDFGLREPDTVLYDGPDITNIVKMFFWCIRLLAKGISQRKKIWKSDQNGVVLNHGDTFSTLLGSVLGKLSGLKTAHVEAGLRSHNLFHPFPEELTRVIVFRLSNYLFAPGEWAADNLKRVQGKVVDTEENTMLDTIRLTLGKKLRTDHLPSTPYAIVSTHRFENIFNKDSVETLVSTLIEISTIVRLVFILHPPTLQQLKKYDLFEILEREENIELRERYNHSDFLSLINASDLVITDGGSNQEECYYLGKPCIIFRKATERREGIGSNAFLSHADKDETVRLVKSCLNMERPSPISSSVSPSSTIVSELDGYYS